MKNINQLQYYVKKNLTKNSPRKSWVTKYYTTKTPDNYVNHF